MAFSLPYGSMTLPYRPKPICSTTHNDEILSIELFLNGRFNMEPFTKNKLSNETSIGRISTIVVGTNCEIIPTVFTAEPMS